MSRFRLVLLAVVALALAGAAVVTWRLRGRGSPVYSHRQLADAARARDRAAIERYLDVGRTAESVVDEASSAAGAQGAADPALKPSLIIAVQQSIWTALLDSLATLEGRYQGLAGVEERGGIARELAVEIMTASAIGSPMLKARAPFVLELPREPWFSLRLMQKDLRLALDASETLGVPLPGAAVSDEIITLARELGYGERDVASLFQVLSRLAGSAASRADTSGATPGE